ncbi:helix-turn-helix domain-containing protein [Mycobacterium sp. CBMA271]|uniref:IclR family transcriptional regulator n=1 Tax=unclassified Mycobacteroides TaxID=2618759 RepID=UPI0012DDAB67|nr:MULTISPECIES: helix-turn-helix domain-containing protein [unclassified Mycobacteroides]MUM17906.1 IclR family transcriptional regulator [Mycobacteroides sp. CBMA 326]MUM20475.1 helix-turn-helix domain-containing protein [Mycobacteroides sp. CBMA 271]
MTKPAPAVVRATEILDYLAGRPTLPLSMTEIAEAVGVNPASTLAILQALTEAGYVVRHPRHKTYSIGPSMLITGHAARVRYEIADAVDTEVRNLATQFGTACTASMIAGEDVAVIASHGRSPAGASYQVGQRIRHSAPAGLVFMAWASDGEVRRWLLRATPMITDELWDAMQAMLAGIREQGYFASVQSDRVDKFYLQLGETARRGTVDERLDTIQSMLASLLARMGEPIDFSAPRRIGFLGAPVFGSDGEVAVMLSVLGTPARLTEAQVADAGNRLRFSADHITSITHGRQGANA